MSLEAALADHAEALRENTALLREIAAGRAEVLEVAKAATEGAKPAKAPAKKKEEPAAESTKAPEPAAADGVPTLEQVNNSIVAYMGATEREEERKARGAKVMEFIKKVNPEGKNGADVPEDKRQVFINTMIQLGERGDITTPEPAAAAATDSLLG